MANRLNRIDMDLQTCYKYDLDWSLLPAELREVFICYFFTTEIMKENEILFIR